MGKKNVPKSQQLKQLKTEIVDVPEKLLPTKKKRLPEKIIKKQVPPSPRRFQEESDHDQSEVGYKTDSDIEKGDFESEEQVKMVPEVRKKLIKNVIESRSSSSSSSSSSSKSSSESASRSNSSSESVQSEEYQKPKRNVKGRLQRIVNKQTKKDNKKIRSQKQEEIQQRNYVPSSIRHLIDDIASQDSANQSDNNFIASDEEGDLKDFKAAQEYLDRSYGVKGERQMDTWMKKWDNVSGEDINSYYQKLDQSNKIEEYEEYIPDSEDDLQNIDLYQIKCMIGMEEDLVMKILQKGCYVHNHPGSTPYNVVSAFSRPKKMPGFIFMEADNKQILQKSISNFYGFRMNTLTKIQFQVFSNVFWNADDKQKNFKVGDYVKVKTGVYTGDLAQITKFQKRNVVVQVVPRVDVELIKKLILDADCMVGNGMTLDEVTSAKNIIVKEYFSNLPARLRREKQAQKKLLTAADFQPFIDIKESKKVKITANGLLVVKYNLQDIQKPKTTVTAQQLITLNGLAQSQKQLIKDQIKNYNVDLDVRQGDLVQIAAGDLKGVYGEMLQKKDNLVIIGCMNRQMSGMKIEQINQNLQKCFIRNSQVVIKKGKNQGDQGRVTRNHTTTVQVLLDTYEQVTVSKRDVCLKVNNTQQWTNDANIKVQDLVRYENKFAMVFRAMKNYFDIMTTENQMKTVKNYQAFQKVSGLEHVQASNMRGRGFKKGTRAKIISGPKQGSEMQVILLWKSFLFLKNELISKKITVWVQDSSNCFLAWQLTAKTAVKYYNRQMRQWSKPYLPPKNMINDPMYSQDYNIGNKIVIPFGCYKGVKGIITHSLKDSIIAAIYQGINVEMQRVALVNLSDKQRGSPRSSRGDRINFYSSRNLEEENLQFAPEGPIIPVVHEANDNQY